MKVLVSGAGGFIGSHVVDELVRHRHAVRAMDLAAVPRPDAEPFVGDVTDPAACARAVQGCEGVVHLAAKVGDWGPAAEYLRVNAGGTRTLARAARGAGVRRFVLVSSLAVHHYRGLRDADESTPRDGRINGYCRSKIAAEDALREAAGPMEAVVARPGVFPFGPRDRLAFPPLAAAIERGGPGFVSGGRALVGISYVENLAGGLRLALEHPAAVGGTFVLADDARVTWHELFSRMAQALGVPAPRMSVPLWTAYPIAAAWEGLYRVLGVRRAPLLTRYRVLLAGRDCHFSNARARTLLGWEPLIDLDEGIRRTVAWYRSDRHG